MDGILKATPRGAMMFTEVELPWQGRGLPVEVCRRQHPRNETMDGLIPRSSVAAAVQVSGLLLLNGATRLELPQQPPMLESGHVMLSGRQTAQMAGPCMTHPFHYGRLASSHQGWKSAVCATSVTLRLLKVLQWSSASTNSL